MSNETRTELQSCEQMVKDVIAQAAEHENSGAWVGHRILNNLHQEFPEAFGFEPPPFIGIGEMLAAENLRAVSL